MFGGRRFSHRAVVWAALDRVLAKHGPFVLVHGAARGADSLGAAWGAARGLTVDPFPADWAAHPRRAGPIRNAAMLAAGLDAAVGFPGGSGTADMERRLVRAGVPVWWPVGGSYHTRTTRTSAESRSGT